MGLCLLLGVVLAVDLRILSVMKNVSFAALHKLLPWAILGFGINVITGVLFFITVPEQYTQNRALQWKELRILAAQKELRILAAEGIKDSCRASFSAAAKSGLELNPVDECRGMEFQSDIGERDDEIGVRRMCESTRGTNKSGRKGPERSRRVSKKRWQCGVEAHEWVSAWWTTPRLR